MHEIIKCTSCLMCFDTHFCDSRWYGEVVWRCSRRQWYCYGTVVSGKSRIVDVFPVYSIVGTGTGESYRSIGAIGTVGRLRQVPYGRKPALGSNAVFCVCTAGDSPTTCLKGCDSSLSRLVISVRHCRDIA